MAIFISYSNFLQLFADKGFSKDTINNMEEYLHKLYSKLRDKTEAIAVVDRVMAISPKCIHILTRMIAEINNGEILENLGKKDDEFDALINALESTKYSKYIDDIKKLITGKYKLEEKLKYSIEVKEYQWFIAKYEDGSSDVYCIIANRRHRIYFINTILHSELANEFMSSILYHKTDKGYIVESDINELKEY